MKINKLLLERIVKEEVSSLREEYKLLENNIKAHEATLKEAWWDTLKRGVKKLTSSDLADMAAEPETKKAVAETAEFMKKIKELKSYEKQLVTLKVTDAASMEETLNDYIQTFKEALEMYNKTEESKKSARFPYLDLQIRSARGMLGRIFDTVSKASEELGKLFSGTEFDKPAQTAATVPAGPSQKPSYGDTGERTRRTRSQVSSPTAPKAGGLAWGVVQENKRKSRITKK